MAGLESGACEACGQEHQFLKRPKDSDTPRFKLAWHLQQLADGFPIIFAPLIWIFHAVIAAGVYLSEATKPTLTQFKLDMGAVAKKLGFGRSYKDLGKIGVNTNNTTGRRSDPKFMEWAILSEHPEPTPGREGFRTFTAAGQVDLRCLFESDSQGYGW